MAGLAVLKKDIDRVRADTNQSLLELRGLLGEWDLGKFLCHGVAWKSWYTVQSMGVILCAIYVNGAPTPELSSAQPVQLYMVYHVPYPGSGTTLTKSYPVPRLHQGHLP